MTSGVRSPPDRFSRAVWMCWRVAEIARPSTPSASGSAWAARVLLGLGEGLLQARDGLDELVDLAERLFRLVQIQRGVAAIARLDVIARLGQAEVRELQPRGDLVGVVLDVVDGRGRVRLA